MKRFRLHITHTVEFDAPDLNDEWIREAYGNTHSLNEALQIDVEQAEKFPEDFITTYGGIKIVGTKASGEIVDV